MSWTMAGNWNIYKKLGIDIFTKPFILQQHHFNILTKSQHSSQGKFKEKNILSVIQSPSVYTPTDYVIYT